MFSIGSKCSQLNLLYYPQKKDNEWCCVRALGLIWENAREGRIPEDLGREGGELCPHGGEGKGNGKAWGGDADWELWGSSAASVAQSPK